MNIKNLISIEKINTYDNIINDKNILYIFNETNYFLNLKNKENINFLNEYLEYFHEDFKNKYTYKDDYLPFIEKFKEIITFKNNDYNNNITFINEIILNKSLLILDSFNETLFEQLALRSNYDLYNINETYFKEIKKHFYSLLNKSFNYYKNVVNNLKNNYKFHNSIKFLLRKQQEEKRLYLKQEINNFSLNYDYNLINMKYDLGEFESKLLKKEYDDYEFIYVYDYVEILENYTAGYIKQIINKIEKIEKIIKQKFENIYNNFYMIYYNEATHEINKKYLKDLNNNYTTCKKYTYDILLNYTQINIDNNNTKNEFINTDNDIYYNIINIINSTFQNCSYNSDKYTGKEILNISLIYNISLIEKINYIQNKSIACFDELENFQNFSNYNETINLLDCYENNFYNYSAFYFINFNETIKTRLDNDINNISLIIKNNIVDDNFLNEFLEKNYLLNNYTGIDLEDISYSFEDMENMINYINYLSKNEYKNLLNNLLITSFNLSYNDLVNNYLLDELVDDISYSILYKLELNIVYIINKTDEEFNYYLLILNSTEQLALSSKKALVNLYQYIKDKLNESLYYLIQDDIYFYLNIFYRENKKLFRNNFINYFNDNINKYGITINKLSDFFDELIIDRQFNSSLDIISKDLIENIIINKIKEKIESTINNKLNLLYNNLDIYMKNMSEIVNQKETKELPNDMEHIVQIINNYTELVKNQNNHFYFKISEKPFIILYDFVKYNLEPPLILIKDQYNTIEVRLLEEITKIVKTFPDNYLFVREKLGFELIIDNITLIIENVTELFEEYNNILIDDLISYINKLIHYTFINGTYTYDSPCNFSFCEINLNLNSTNETRRLEENNNNKNNNNFILIQKPDKKNVKKLINKKIRKLTEYDHTMGPVTRNDVSSLLFDLESTLYEFNKTFLKKEYRDINRNILQYFNKINNTYLIRLKRTIDMISLKFSTFLTNNNYKVFEKIVYKQYNDIEFYINNFSDLIENKKNDLINLLNDSSLMLEKIFNLSYHNVNSTYEIFYNKYFSLSKEETEKKVNIIVRIVRKINKLLIDYDLEATGSVSMTSEFFKDIKGLNIGINLCKTFGPDINATNFTFFSCSFIELAFVIKPVVEVGICFELGFDLNWDKREYSFYIDVYGKAEVSVYLEVGAYVPSVYSPIQTSLSLGLKGVLGSGKAGIKLDLFFNKSRYATTLYAEFNALMLSFYILFRFVADFEVCEINFEFYIINKLLFGLKFEVHSTVIRTYKSKRIETDDGNMLSCLMVKSKKKYKGTKCHEF